MRKDCPSRGLGIYSGEKEILYFSAGTEDFLRIDTSPDGLNFIPSDRKAQIIGPRRRPLTVRYLADLRLCQIGSLYLMTGLIQKPKPTLFTAYSTNLTEWRSLGQAARIPAAAVTTWGDRDHAYLRLFFGGKTLHSAFNRDGKRWVIDRKKNHFFPSGPHLSYIAGTCLSTPAHQLIYLVIRENPPDRTIIQTYAVRLGPDGEPLPEPRLIWQTSRSHADPLGRLVGIVYFNHRLIAYWQTADGKLLSFDHAYSIPPSWSARSPNIMRRLSRNPLLSPVNDHSWESVAVFNPAAIVDQGRIHLIYRAVGPQGLSTLGYANSRDGLTIDQRLPYPVYRPTQTFEGCHAPRTGHRWSPYQSGEGWGGCEDPRLTKIGPKIFMTYVAYDGLHPPRVALTSIALTDFRRRRWNWQKPVLISPPGVVDKNACILPEKVNGKFVIFHRIFPDILVDFVDSLDFDGHSWLKGEHRIAPRPDHWDSRKLGIGPPPIKTDAGWLAIYQAVDDRRPSQYHIGAMLLDKNDPSQVLHRSHQPLLSPLTDYENYGHKYGVVYPCGAVVRDQRLITYYGGSDQYVCGAVADLSSVINYLQSEKPSDLPHLSFLPIYHD